MRTQAITSLGRFCFGGDWNPEQWPDGTWNDDLDMLSRAGINEATINVFGWGLLQPDEATYDFTTLDKIVDKLVAHGFGIIMGTATAAMPAWMPLAHPEVTRTDSAGRHHHFGLRHNACPNSPIYRQMSTALAGKLAERYSQTPGLMAWHVNNEYGGLCFCGNCAAAFRDWLKAKYGDLDTLNAAWNTNFWSHTYMDFAQIFPPDELGDGLGGNKSALSGHMLDYRRFQSESILANYRSEADAIRRFDPNTPITTNFMAVYEGLDYFDWGKHLDTISWDNYPAWNSNPADIAFRHDLMRGVGGGQPFLLMESTPGQTNWQSINSLRAPGVMRLESYQAIAHGADSIQYFQLRQSLGGDEKYHGAVIGHAHSENDRVYREVQELGQELGKHGTRFLGGTSTAKVGIIFDWESYWSIECTSWQPASFDYVEALLAWYHELFDRNIAVDVLPADAGTEQLSKYAMVIAPTLIMFQGDMAETLESYVRSGGTLIATILSGMHDEHDNVIPGGYPGPLRDVCGVRVTEIDMLPSEKDVPIDFLDGTTSTELNHAPHASAIAGLLQPEGATPFAVYAGDVFYHGTPAVTSHTLGRGHTWFVGAALDAKGTGEVLDAALSQCGITGISSPDGVEITRRHCNTATNDEGCHDLVFILNHTNHEVSLDTTAFAGARSLLDGTMTGTKMTLEPHGVTILEQQ